MVGHFLHDVTYILYTCVPYSTMAEPVPVVIFSMGKDQYNSVATALKNDGVDMDPQIQHNMIYTTFGFYT
jgi:hypothetical protein